MKLTFVRKQHEVGEVWSYFFKPHSMPQWEAGQYLNLEMPGLPPVYSDRILTIASAPHEETLQFTTLLGPSSFKQKLNSLNSGDQIEADQLGGDFIYDLSPYVMLTAAERSGADGKGEPFGKPRLSDQRNGQAKMVKRLFIAGGIGVTPYVSIIRDRLHKKLPINATLLYAGKNEKRPFVNELQQATLADPTFILKEYSEVRLTLDQLKKDIDDIESYVVYLAGSQKFSEQLGEGLVAEGFPRNQIKYDYFDGYIDIEYA